MARPLGDLGGEHGELLFSRNIRGALVGTDVNDGVIATAREDPSRFWFFNNGVTVIAESSGQAPYANQKSGNFNFRRANVINGARTVSVLTRASLESPGLLESADVFVRFVTLEDPDGEFARLVTCRTNTQNRVGGREFVALDPQQERLRMSHLKLNKASVSDFRPPFSKDRVDGLTLLAADGLNQVVLKEYPDAYPAPLFKNQSKCKVIGSKLLDYLVKRDLKGEK